MSQNYGKGPPDPADVIEQMMNRLGKKSRHLGPVVLAILILVVAAFGLYQVEPGEVAVIRTLGKETSRSEPGLHFRVPGIQQYDIVNVSSVRRLEVGFRGDQPRPLEAQMLTGDENMVDAQMIVQYRVADPSKYLFRLREPADSLHATAEVALRSVIGQTTIDEAITKGRGTVQTKTRDLLQRLMDEYESGLVVTEVKLQSVDPPDEVKDAFHEVVRAREKKEELINQAKGYSEDIIPRARGEAVEQVQLAEGYRQGRILRAQGDAEKFDDVYAEYSKAKHVTRRRLYLETMGRILTQVPDKTVVDSNLPGSTLPVLPLGKKAVAAGAAATAAAPAPEGGQK
jgi:membrane protease subunit HflK